MEVVTFAVTEAIQSGCRRVRGDQADRAGTARAARFQATRNLDTFEFTAISSLNRMLVLELARSDCILRRETIIAVAHSGTGRTHIALAKARSVRKEARARCDNIALRPMTNDGVN